MAADIEEMLDMATKLEIPCLEGASPKQNRVADVR